MFGFSRWAGLVAAALFALAWVVPAQALTVRAWVSGHGSDVASCGAPATPCRTLQYTHDNIVAAGGEIDILDPAGYGTIVINKAISIVNDGVGTAGVQANSGNAITINAGTGNVRLRGLNIEGLNAAANGIVVNTAATLSIEDCTVKDFTANQLLFQPTASSYLHVSNTRFEHGGNTFGDGNGVYVHPLIPSGLGLVQAVFERIEATDDLTGIYVDGTGANVYGIIKVTVADSVADDDQSGVLAISTGTGANTFVMVRNTTASNNRLSGIEADGAASVFVAHSALSGNGGAFGRGGAGVIGSYGDNDVDGNIGPGSTPTVESLH